MTAAKNIQLGGYGLLYTLGAAENSVFFKPKNLIPTSEKKIILWGENEINLNDVRFIQIKGKKY